MADIKFLGKTYSGINKLNILRADESGYEIFSISGTGETSLVDMPETMGQRACLARAAQMRDIQYTLKGEMPVIGGTYLEGKIVTGLPYSSVRKTDRFIGFNISLYTFMTAINNPRSLLYTTTAADNTADNGSIANTYYGTNCSTFASYCHGWDYHSATNTIPELPYITEIAPADMKLCDLPVASLDHGGSLGHATMITGITRNEDGTIDTLEISESNGSVIRAVSMTYSDFITNYINGQGYKVYRDSQLYGASYKASPFVQVFEDEPSVNFTYSNLCTNRGDKVTITPDEEIKLNVLIDSGYESIKLLKDGVDYAEYTITGGDFVDGDVSLSGLTAGMYMATLYDSSGNAVDNAYTSFEVVEVSAAQNENRFSFSGIGGVPVRVVYKDSRGYTLAVFDITESEIARGYKYISGYSGETPAQVCVPFETTYGFAVARLDYDSSIQPDIPDVMIPAEYQQVEYIATDGNQYIDTGVMASNYADGINYKFSGNVTAYHDSLNNNYLYGCLSGGVRSGNAAFSSVSGFVFYVGTSSIQVTNYNYSEVGKDFVIDIIDASSTGTENTAVTFNGKSLNVSSAEKGEMPAANIFLLACNLNGNPTSATSTMFNGKLYSFTMTESDGTAIRNFVPCYRKSDGVIGLYDTVGGVFYTNKGTGSFTKGADV